MSPPTPPDEPRVVFWYRIYCAGMAALYLLCLVAVLGLLVFSDEIAAAEVDLDVGRIVFGILLFVLGFLLVAAYLAAFFLPRTRGAWIYHIVLISFGLTSICTIPVSLPLLIYWLKPETQSWFRT